MRKSTLLLLLVIQMLLLFVFENVYFLLKQQEKNISAEIRQTSEWLAESAGQRYGADLSRIRLQGYFDSVGISGQRGESRQTETSGKNLVYIIRQPLADGRSLVFTKTLDSPLLRLNQRLKKLFSGVTIVLGIFLFLTGLLLILSFKKSREGKPIAAGEIPPLQNYLVELKNVQQELQDILSEQSRSSLQREELNKSIINNLHLALIFLSPVGKIEIFNPAAQALFSRSFAQAKNSALREVLGDYPEIVEYAGSCSVKGSLEIESRQRQFQVDVIPVQDIGKLILLRDVTEEKQREQNERINSSLLILGEIAAALAHEIKNSLGVIYGYARSIQGEAAKTSKISAEVNFLGSLMENLLSFTKPLDKVERRPTDLRPLLSHLAETNKLALQLPPYEMMLSSDPILLSVIFSNLILNSRQAGADHIRVEFQKGDTCEITLCDNGPGIDEQIRPRIWLPFFSTKEKGTGMGLAIVQKMVHALNGDIQLLPPAGGGSSFRITFYG